MKIHDYFNQVLMPANTAISSMRIAGMPIDLKRAERQMDAWEDELKKLESFVEKKGKAVGIHYSPAHSCQDQPLLDLLYLSPKGLGLKVMKRGKPRKGWPDGRPSADDEALMTYAAIGAIHRDDDHPVVHTILKIRSISKARNTHLGGLIKWRRSDGCVHPKFKWILPNTTRLSAEDPPVHQLPERSDPVIAKLVKSVIVPRIKPWLGDIDDWDPRKHGWVAKADVKGAEAVIRAGVIAKCRTSVPYLRTGGDIHSKTASILYKVPEGTYTKGMQERDTVGKQSYFLLIFGGSWRALQRTLWKEARMAISDGEAKRLHASFFDAEGYPDLDARYEIDTQLMVDRGYIEDLYGRRWTMLLPPGFEMYKEKGKIKFYPPSDLNKEDLKSAFRTLENRRHIYANRPTQTTQATTTLFCIALCKHGEYVELRVPPYFEERGGNLFPEAKTWQLNEGRGPGGKPMQVWMMNTVHDSLWLDGAPGYLEPMAKTIVRRFNGVPAEFLYEANMPWRVEIEVGPDLGHLRPYNVVAKEFGLEPLPER